MKRLGKALFLIACLPMGFGIPGCGDDDGGGAVVSDCNPVNACSCGPGTERPTACTCTGGSNCEIAGSDIEFQCGGNAACGMTCGTNCLITCPGTTSCTVDVGDRGAITCPGTASCEVHCRASCTVDMAGAATSLVYCEGAAQGAACDIQGCSPEDCGNDVFACGMACP